MTDLEQRIDRLSPRQLNLLSAQLAATSGNQAEAPREAALVAYVVPDPAHPVSAEELRSHLQKSLPDYMVPAAFVLLPELPRTSNGKVDVRSLPDPEMDSDRGPVYVAPRNALEETLTAIWERVLGIDRIGVRDNFFEIGGDSILSIQIVARMRQSGLKVAPNQLFEHQSIAELAAAIVPGSAQPVAGPIVHTSALTPIQHWFFEQGLPDPHYWHQSVWVDLPDDVEPMLLQHALQEVVDHHDVLRASFDRGASTWQQSFADKGEARVRVELHSGDDPAYGREGTGIEDAAARLHASMQLESAPLLRALWIRGASGGGHRVLLSIHHLVVDPLSWQIILEDLQTACEQLKRGEPLRLPSLSSPFRLWTAALEDYAKSHHVHEELPHWTSPSYARAASFPRDFPGRFLEADAESLTTVLSAEETQRLQSRAHSAYGTNTEDLLLAALLEAAAPWTGYSELLVGLERHGREEVREGLDLSRTVGWFTAYFPILLSLARGGGAPAAIKRVKETLRAVPRQGIGYGVLRYLHEDPEIRNALRTLPQPEIIFNYTGKSDAPLLDGGAFRVSRPLFPSRAPTNHRNHLLEVNAYVQGGRLTVQWSFSRGIYRRETIEQLAAAHMDALRSLISHCVSPEAGGYTPSDFPEADLSQDDLDRLLSRLLDKRGE